jgi:hypothetical protein
MKKLAVPVMLATKARDREIGGFWCCDQGRAGVWRGQTGWIFERTGNKSEEKMRVSGRIRSGKKYGIGQKGPGGSVSGGGAFASAVVHPWVSVRAMPLSVAAWGFRVEGSVAGPSSLWNGSSPGWAATLRALRP